MTLKDIAAFLTDIDPDISNYESMEKRDPYTFWEETRRLPFTADGAHEEGWRFYVHRYTQEEEDPIAAALMTALDTSDRITVTHTVDYIPEKDLIHHIFECEAY